MGPEVKQRTYITQSNPRNSPLSVFSHASLQLSRRSSQLPNPKKPLLQILSRSPQLSSRRHSPIPSSPPATESPAAATLQSPAAATPPPHHLPYRSRICSSPARTEPQRRRPASFPLLSCLLLRWRRGPSTSSWRQVAASSLSTWKSSSTQDQYRPRSSSALEFYKPPLSSSIGSANQTVGAPLVVVLVPPNVLHAVQQLLLRPAPPVPAATPALLLQVQTGEAIMYSCWLYEMLYSWMLVCYLYRKW